MVMNDALRILFSPFRIGPFALRNRVIRAAAFEGLCPGNNPSEQLLNYHEALAKGGVAMTTVAYAAVTKSGLSFKHQLWLRDEAVAGLKKLTDAVHRHGAACSIQIGHCGNMASAAVSGSRPMAPSTRFNLYGPNFPRAMRRDEIQNLAENFGKAVRLARSAGFDAVEVHAGHGYLISQFLSPFTNHRKDEYGGSLENRARFLQLVLREVRRAAGNDLAVLVKMNMRDGFRGGMETDEALVVAKIIESEGADALVLSGGFVSKAPMYVLRGAMPVRILAHYMDDRLKKQFVRLFGSWLIRPEPFREAYFLEDALQFRSQVRLPLVYVGGLLSREKIDEVLGHGFELVALARALIREPDFVHKMLSEHLAHSYCDTCNYCIAAMYSRAASCVQNEQVPEGILKLLHAS
jgi:2,4-dienoyl-CoA reductase-like NADH-dependent reductase (Old Yellow Enzyme family)